MTSILRQFMAARPFRPFRIVLTGGSEVPVTAPRPDRDPRRRRDGRHRDPRRLPPHLRPQPPGGDQVMSTTTFATTPTTTPIHRITVDEFEAMIEAGIYGKRDRIELIEGMLVEQMTKGERHSAGVGRSWSTIMRALPAGWHVRVEMPVVVPGRQSRPEPDVAAARGEYDDFARRGRTPGAADVGLVVEVSDSSLEDDRVGPGCSSTAGSRPCGSWTWPGVASRSTAAARGRRCSTRGARSTSCSTAGSWPGSPWRTCSRDGRDRHLDGDARRHRPDRLQPVPAQAALARVRRRHGPRRSDQIAQGRAGRDREWNRWREKDEVIPDFRHADLSDADLRHADLSRVRRLHRNSS